MKIRRLPQAISDVDDIWLYIASDDPVAAFRTVERIAEAVERLADYPELGRARPEIGENARSLTVGNYLVLYRIVEDAIEIARVMHGARDVKGIGI